LTERRRINFVSWRDLLPWLVIVRAVREAFRAPMMAFAIAGALLTPIGWRVAEVLLPRESVAEAEMAALVARNRGWTHSSATPFSARANETERVRTIGGAVDRALALPLDLAERFTILSGPLRRLFTGPPRFRELAYLLTGSLWSILIWAIFGGAIARMAAVSLGREDRLGAVAALKETLRKLGSLLAAPLMPMAAALLIAAGLALAGLLLRADFGAIVVGTTWALVLVAALVMALLLIGLLFGWPLMWATIGAEGSDAFDALSRSFAYTYQRPLNYLAYAVIAACLGALGYLGVSFLTTAVEELAWWSAAWGAGEQRIAEVRLAVDGAFHNGVGGSLGFGVAMIRIAVGALRLVSVAYGYSFFWCAATAIYLLLRSDVDRTEFDEIYSEDDSPLPSPPSLRVAETGKAAAPLSSEDDSE
jgi:hypothetical protein